MDIEIARVGREMYKAFSGLNEGFEEVDKLTIIQTGAERSSSSRTRIPKVDILKTKIFVSVAKDVLEWKKYCNSIDDQEIIFWADSAVCQL